MATNSRYLTLALDIRKLSDSLIKLAEEGDAESPVVRTSIQNLLVSLLNAGEKTSVKALRERGAFGRYENVVTVNEVVKPPQRAEFIRKLQAVLTPASEDDLRESALQAVEFFDTLEQRALYHYRHPKLTASVSIAS
jgi:hypothetical protein